MSANEDQLKAERKKLERVQREYNERLPKEEQKLKAALENGDQGYAARQLHQRVQDDFDTWKTGYEDFIDVTKQRIADLEGQLKQQQDDAHKQARAELDAEKEIRKKQWIINGGSAQSFEENWPSIEAEILKERTKAPEYDMAEAIRKKREGFSL